MAQPQQGTRLPPTVASKVNEVMDSQKPINTQVDQIIQVFPRIQASRKVPISKSATSSQYTASTSYQRNFRKPFKQLEPFLAMHFEHVYFWVVSHLSNLWQSHAIAQICLLLAIQVGHGPFLGTAWHVKTKAIFMAVHNVIS